MPNGAWQNGRGPTVVFVDILLNNLTIPTTYGDISVNVTLGGWCQRVNRRLVPTWLYSACCLFSRLCHRAATGVDIAIMLP